MGAMLHACKWVPGVKMMDSEVAMMAGNEKKIFGDVLPAKEGYPQPELGLTIAIVLAGRRWRALIDEQLRERGQSASRMEAMSAIAYAPKQATQIQIAKRIGIEGPTLTRTLDMLEADGLVERVADPSDRRNKHMKITPAGFEELGTMLDICAKSRSRLLAGIPAKDIKAGLGFLSLLLERIEGGLDSPPDE